VNPPCSFTSEEISYLTSRIQNGGTEVVEVCFSSESTPSISFYLPLARSFLKQDLDL
jgi:hypothetical protein